MAKSLGFEGKLSGKSFIYMKKVVYPELNLLEGTLLQYLSILNADRLELLFASYQLEN